MFAVERKQQVSNLVPGFAVKITGRLISEQDLRATVKRARQRHALLLPAGKLCREMVEPFA